MTAGGARPEGALRITVKAAAGVAAARLLSTIAVLLAGFRAVSDDDFSRAVIAEQWAASPRLDPSGTSWLPFPFWLNGAAMLLLGRGLFAARAVAIASGLASSLLVAIAAQRLTADRRAALLAGAFASLAAWPAWLGVATVPELLTAALTLFAATSLTGAAPRRRAQGALALLLATLSRYEPWPVALAFAAANLTVPPRAADPAAPRARAAAWPLRAATSLLAIAGPLLWIAWNRAAHGDALHFLARVTAYRRALGEGAGDSPASRLLAYPAALAREMPEIAIPAALVLLFALHPARRPLITAAIRRAAAPLLLAAAQIAALSISLIKDGAPTHHPERAVLFPALVLIVVVASVLSALWSDIHASAAPAIAALGAAAMLARAAIVPRSPASSFTPRRAEVEIGERYRALAPPGRKALLLIKDYGYFAVLAASGRPEDIVLSHDIDPRRPTEPPRWETRDEYVKWLHDRGIAYIIAPSGDPSIPRSPGDGAPLAAAGGLEILAAPAR